MKFTMKIRLGHTPNIFAGRTSAQGAHNKIGHKNDKKTMKSIF